MSKTNKRFLSIILAAAAGGVLGGTLASRAGLHAHNLPGMVHFSPGMLAAILLIALFDVYWSAAAKNSAPTQSSESKRSRQMHVIPLNLAILLLILSIPGLTKRFAPASRVLTVVGLLVEAGGILFAIWARRTLGANWSGEVRIASGHQLVHSGPYAHIRHPIYTGILAMYLGAMLVSGEVHALIAMVVILLLYLRKIGLEEKVLAVNFGAVWEDWRRESWALLPPVY